MNKLKQLNKIQKEIIKLKTENRRYGQMIKSIYVNKQLEFAFIRDPKTEKKDLHIQKLDKLIDDKWNLIIKQCQNGEKILELRIQQALIARGMYVN